MCIRVFLPPPQRLLWADDDDDRNVALHGDRAKHLGTDGGREEGHPRRRRPHTKHGPTVRDAPSRRS